MRERADETEGDKDRGETENNLSIEGPELGQTSSLYKVWKFVIPRLLLG